MGNSYKNCKIQDNTAELIFENGSLFVTIFENNIVHVAQKPGIESVAIEEGFIPKAATPDVTSKDTSDAKGIAAEAGVSDAAVKVVISAKDIAVNVKDNEKLDIYYNGKLRMLTAKEHLRLMGFKDTDYNHMSKCGLTDQQISYLAGNSICIPVLMELYKELMKLELI